MMERRAARRRGVRPGGGRSLNRKHTATEQPARVDTKGGRTTARPSSSDRVQATGVPALAVATLVGIHTANVDQLFVTHTAEATHGFDILLPARPTSPPRLA